MVLAVLALVLFLARFPLLRGMARVLIVDDGNASSPAVMPVGPRYYQEAAEHYHAHKNGQVLLFQGKLDRLEEMGIVPTAEAIACRELPRLRVPAEALQVLRSNGNRDWDLARALAAWLNDHPESQVVVVANRFATRRLRLVVNRVVPAADAGRVRLQAVPHPEYDENNWWTSKYGVLDVFGSYLRLGYGWLYGEDAPGSSWDPNAYEQTLIQQP
ncbi:hypothetical protein AYO44_05185 [Planctomycetaceae bacterium SCGC AG-212-F19]|nr:hypothetical protein AYO44_05185 [Planctomycetaceae bacterium SCGC AG-212-F19]